MFSKFDSLKKVRSVLSVMLLFLLSGTKMGSIRSLAQGSPTVTEYAIPTENSRPFGITIGSDGALWFAEGDGNMIGRITTAGEISEYPLPTADSNPGYLAE